MQFIEDWKRKSPKLWSVRLALLAALASSVEVAFNLYVSGTAPLLVICSAVISIGAAGARIIAQPSLTNE